MEGSFLVLFSFLTPIPNSETQLPMHAVLTLFGFLRTNRLAIHSRSLFFLAQVLFVGTGCRICQVPSEASEMGVKILFEGLSPALLTLRQTTLAITRTSPSGPTPPTIPQ